jgi:hypothetical protein
MNRRIFLTTTAAACLAIGTTLMAQGFGLRTGSWSITMTAQGGMPMEGIPPAMRAQIEAEMKKPNTFTTCVTAEDLKNLKLGKTDDSDDEDCKAVNVKVSATVADFTKQCTGDEPSTETSHFEASSPTAFTGTVNKKTPKGTTTINLSGKWVSAKCAE